MIAERISLIEIYRSLLRLQTNEGMIRDIVLDRRIDSKTKSPEAFKDLEHLKTFINKTYPFVSLESDTQICTWFPYSPVKFWVEKDNGILVQFKQELTTKKSSLFAMSKKKLRELQAFLNKLTGSIGFDDYISPSTPTYVECVYIDDVIETDSYYWLIQEYKKYIIL
jgi:hypothetical protein